MRVFIAIDINEQVKKAIERLQQQLADKAGIKRRDAKWVSPEAMHLTLKFIGEVKDDRIVELCNIVQNVASAHKSFDLDIGSVGYFGRKSATILWVAANAASGDLNIIQEQLERKLALAGWPEETREFTGHLTLCRVKNIKAGIKLAAEGCDYDDCKLGSSLADELVVYQSRLTPTGPVYTTLSRCKLAFGT